MKKNHISFVQKASLIGMFLAYGAFSHAISASTAASIYYAITCSDGTDCPFENNYKLALNYEVQAYSNLYESGESLDVQNQFPLIASLAYKANVPFDEIVKATLERTLNTIQGLSPSDYLK